MKTEAVIFSRVLIVECIFCVKRRLPIYFPQIYIALEFVFAFNSESVPSYMENFMYKTWRELQLQQLSFECCMELINQKHIYVPGF